jgi:hypothetical protein
MSAELRDREAFLGRVRREPLFLAAHIPALISVVVRKLENRVRMMRRDPHLGAKKLPAWIRNHLFGDRNDHDCRLCSLFQLPRYSLSLGSNGDFPENLTTGNSSACDSDPELLFEANRWRYLCELLLCVEPEVVHALVRARQWMAGNQDQHDIAWEPYSASERVANLLVWLSCIRDEFGGNMDEVSDLRLFVEKSLDWICSHLEYYGERNTNNHILNNARALVMGGVALGNDRSYWAGMETFRQFLPRLIANDGFLRERSSHYQLVIANWILDTWRFVEDRFGDDDPDAIFLKGYAKKITAAAAMLCDENGELLGCIGDISPDASPRLSSRRLAVLYPEYWPAEKKSQIGSVAVSDDWFRIDNDRQCVLGNFPSGGYPPNFPTHGHGDYTGFVWRVGDVSILADSGRYRYTADGVSVMQKCALGHSVPLVNGFAPLCESILRNGMWWPRPYAVAHMKLTIDGEYVWMSHDGFARATPVRLHKRRVGLVAEGIEVEDQFDGTESVAVQLRWNFGPGFETFDAEKFSVTGADGEVRISVSGFDGKPKFRVLRADDSGGWFSDMYGVKSPSLVLDVEGRVSLAASIKTCFEIVHVRNSRNPEI